MPWASVFDNVWLPLRLQGVSRASGELADSFREVDEAAASAVSVARHAVETSHAGRSRLEQLRAVSGEGQIHARHA